MSNKPKLIIHVGPGKTGSSVIQEWLSSNRKLLLDEGYLYPKHKVDKNGISSGNFRSIFSEDKNGRFIFDVDKASSLIEHAERDGVEYILLSSEAFINLVKPLAEYFEDVHFIFYLRNPIESSESLYNQSVKRHFNTLLITTPKVVSFNKLLKLHELTKSFAHRLSLRFYGDNFFSGGNIVQDFLETIGLRRITVTNAKVINGSYSFEALEFKRLLNQFPLIELHQELDVFLQQYQGDISSFSVYSEEQFEEYKGKATVALENMFSLLGLENSSFQKVVEEQTQRERFSQVLSEPAASKILQSMYEYSPSLFSQVRNIVSSKYLSFLDFSPLNDQMFDYIARPISPVKRSLSTLMRKLVKPEVSYSLTGSPTRENIASLMQALRVKRHMDEGKFLRELALYFEAEGDILQAFKYMNRAKFFRPQGELINRKLCEYADVINTINIKQFE